MMKAGTYWVGDLCYAMGQDWKEFCALTIKGDNVDDGEFELADGTKFAFRGTAYGDGTYYDEQGREYPVDSGLIGCILVSDIKPTISDIFGGNIIEFAEDFEVVYNDGVIEFGHQVAIDTDPSGDEDEEEYEEEDDEE